MKDTSVSCSAEIGSVTQAMRAQNALSAVAIPTKLIKSQSSSRHGCIYGVSYSCSQENNVRAVLANARIPVRHWNKDQTI